MHTATLSDDATEACCFRLTEQASPSSKKIEYTLTFDNIAAKETWLIHFNTVQRDVIRYRKVFGVPLKTLVKRENQNIPHFIEKSISFIREYGVDAEGIFRH